MKTTPEHNERIAKMTFASVYPHYVTKVEKKGRTQEELKQVIEWLTGFDEKKTSTTHRRKSEFCRFLCTVQTEPQSRTDYRCDLWLPD